MYQIGTNRLFYSSESCFGKTVEIDVLSPDLVRSEKQTMLPVDDVFYADVYFNVKGSYLIRVFENGELKHRDVLIVSSGNLILYPEG